MFSLKGHLVCQVNDATNSLLKHESYLWIIVRFKSDLCEKFFKPEPLLFMISLVIFPKQHEERVSQPKVYAQTHTQTPTVMILWCKKWISDPGIKWSVPHDSKCLRNPWFLPYFTWQGPSALLPHSHFKAFFSCVFWVRTWISLVQYVLQWWWHRSQN